MCCSSVARCLTLSSWQYGHCHRVKYSSGGAHPVAGRAGDGLTGDEHHTAATLPVRQRVLPLVCNAVNPGFIRLPLLEICDWNVDQMVHKCSKEC